MRVNFPVGAVVVARERPPHLRAVWIAPELRWDRYRHDYVMVLGYWTKRKHHRAQWVAGSWKYTRRGYYWQSGYWV